MEANLAETEDHDLHLFMAKTLYEMVFLMKRV